jgi:hypothetical protein
MKHRAQQRIAGRRAALAALAAALFALAAAACAVSGPDYVRTAGSPATFYFDSAAGDDSNSGLSPESPLRDLAILNDLPLYPGDAVLLKRGSAWSVNLTLVDSGRADAPIRLDAYGQGAAPRLAGAAAGRSTLTLGGAHFAARNLHFAGAVQGAAIFLRASAAAVVVEGCEIEAVGVGIAVGGSGHRLRGNLIHDLAMIRDTPGGDDDYGAVGIYLADTADIEISGNRFYRCRAPSHDYGWDGGAIETWNGADGVRVFGNYSQDDNGFFELGADRAATVSGVDIHHNISVNDGSLFLPHLDGNFAVSVSGVRFANNTALCSVAVPGLAFFNAGGHDLTAGQLEVVNNVFVSVNPVYGFGDGGFVHAGNWYDIPIGGAILAGGGFAADPSEGTGDAQIGTVDADGYTIDEASPLVDGGVATAYSADYAGHALPNGAGYDRGAIER